MGLSTELGEKLAALRDDFVKATSVEKPTGEDIEKAQKMHGDLTEMETRYTNLRALDNAAEAAKEAQEVDARSSNMIPFNGANGRPPANGQSLSIPSMPQQKAWSQLLEETSDYKQIMKSGGFREGQTYVIEVPGSLSSYKAAGDPIMSSQFQSITTYPGLDLHVLVMPKVYDLCTKISVNVSAIRYYQATSPITGDAAAVAEGALKPEVQPRWAPVTSPVETVAEWTAVTLQALQDVPQLRAAIDNDLRRILLLKVDEYLLTGTGTAPQIRGILNTVGIQTQAFSTSAINTLSLAVSKIADTGNGYPTAIVMNPTDWQALSLITQGASGPYVFGPATDSPIMRAWGIPIVTTPKMTAGFALVGDFSFAQIFERTGVIFIVGWKNDDIIKNLQTIVCEIRFAFGVTRPSAFVNADIVTP